MHTKVFTAVRSNNLSLTQYGHFHVLNFCELKDLCGDEVIFETFHNDLLTMYFFNHAIIQVLIYVFTL